MTYILVIWTLVATGNTGTSSHNSYHDYRPIGEFKNLQACQHASKFLNVGARSVCLPTDTKAK